MPNLSNCFNALLYSRSAKTFAGSLETFLNSLPVLFCFPLTKICQYLSNYRIQCLVFEINYEYTHYIEEALGTGVPSIARFSALPGNYFP